MATEKICPKCQAVFVCGKVGEAERCWCAALPRIMPVDPARGCMCPDCLRREIDRRIAARNAEEA